MRSTLLAAGLAVAGLALFTGTAEARLVTTEAVRGRLDPTDDTSDALGRFHMVVRTRGDASAEQFLLEARGLDATRDGSGNLPSYHAFAVTSDGNTQADFGEIFLSSRGGARFRFSSPREEFPSGVTTLKDFAGGTVEVRLGDSIILSGRVPDFLGVDDGNGSGSGARARIVGTNRLQATADGGRARGRITAAYANTPNGEFEEVVVGCDNLGYRGRTFTVVVIDGQRNETTLGTMTTRTYDSVGLLDLSTRAGDAIPGPGVRRMGGWTVEVRDARGTAWLTGTFPDLSGGQ